MRRALVAVAVLLLLLVGWFVLRGDKSDLRSGASDSATAADPAAEPAKAGPVRASRKKTPEEIHEEVVSEFLTQWPELGQDKEQDPKLGAITGRVLVAQERPAKEGVVESAARGELTARTRLKEGGAFLVKNVPPGKAVSLTARAPNYAPGGYDKLVVGAGQTIDVGAVYLGAAIDPAVTDRIEIRVVKEEDKSPIAGARVTATSTLFDALIVLGPHVKQPGGTVVKKATDEKGVVVFEKLPPGSYDFFVEADGLTFEVERRRLVQKDTQDVLTIELGASQSIEGKVVDENGEPIADARVGAFRLGNFQMYPAVQSDAEGRFAVTGLVGGDYMMFAVKPEIGSKELPKVAAGVRDLTITVTPGAEMVLRITDAATGAPVKDFAVRPFQTRPFAYIYSAHFDAKAEDGLWRQKMAPQSYGVEVAAKGYARKSVPSVKVPCAEPFEIKLETAGVVHGKVTAKATGRQVIGARVFVKRGGFPPSPEQALQTVTDGEGVFVLENLPRSPTTLCIAHADCTEAQFQVTPQPRDAAGAPPPAQDFVLSAGGRIEGHAFGPGRKPLVGNTILLMKGFDPYSMRNATVAADGSYAMTNIPPDTYRVSTDGWGGDSKNGVVVADGAVVVVDFGMDSGGQRLVGRVVKEDQTPVGSMSVTLEGAGGANQQTASDAQGVFAFENVPPGAYAVRGGWGRTKVADVVVKAEEPPAEVVLVLLEGSLEGRIVDAATDKPLPGAWIDCEMTADAKGVAPPTSRAGRWGRQTGDDGVFRFGSLEEGRYRVRAYLDPYGTEMVDAIAVGAGEKKTGVEVRLSSAVGSVAGTVRSASPQAPVEGAAVQVKDAQGRSVFFLSMTTTSGDGTFAQGQLKAGEYDVTIEKDGFAPSTQHMTVEAGKVAKADFVLRQGGTIEVTGWFTKVDPAAGASVALLDPSGVEVRKGLSLSNIFNTDAPKTDAHGQITIRGLAPGQYVVRLKKPAGGEAAKSVDVVEGGNSAVEIHFPAQ